MERRGRGKYSPNGGPTPFAYSRPRQRTRPARIHPRPSPGASAVKPLYRRQRTAVLACLEDPSDGLAELRGALAARAAKVEVLPSVLAAGVRGFQARSLSRRATDPSIGMARWDRVARSWRGPEHREAPPNLGYSSSMSSRLDKSWKVVASPSTASVDRCVDIFVRPDGTFGFEEFRRDPEDMGEWTPVAYFSVHEYESQDEAVAAARASVRWLPEVLDS